MLGWRRVLLRAHRRGVCSPRLRSKLRTRRRVRRARTRARRLVVGASMDSVDEMDVVTPSAEISWQGCPSKRPPERPKLAFVHSAGDAGEGDDVDMAVDGTVLDSTVTAQAEAVADAEAKVKRQIVMLPSVFEGRPPVLFFTYTTACGAKQRPLERAVYADIDGPRAFYSHTDAIHEYNAVVNAMRQGGLWRVKPETQRWLLLWNTHPSPEILQAMKPTQRTNHFPGSQNLGRKDLLWRNISRMQRRFGKPYTITPQGFVLPKAVLQWEAAKAKSPEALWIWKPCAQSCGRGIKVVSGDMPQDEFRELARKRGIVQRYVANPLLIQGYKFDLRIYVVVLSYDPLKVYINDEGLVRLATAKYSADPSTLENRTMHLTNYSVNKLSPAFIQNKDGRDDCVIKYRNDRKERPSVDESTPVAPVDLPSCKWSMSELRENFAQRGLDYNLMRSRINDVVLKTLIAVEPQLQAEWCKSLDDIDAGWLARGANGARCDSTSSCFELYGFDILIDSELKPWLLEVNICPSLSSGSPLDKRIKTKLVADYLTLLGVRPPPNVWRRYVECVTKPSSDVVGMGSDDSEGAPGARYAPSDLTARAAKMAKCENPLDAIALFDDLAWELVLESHDEDMRSGGLQRIYPTEHSSQYVPFLDCESYCNLVLRKWYEAGGSLLFGSDKQPAHAAVPPWVPRQVNFNKT